LHYCSRLLPPTSLVWSTPTQMLLAENPPPNPLSETQRPTS